MTLKEYLTKNGIKYDTTGKDLSVCSKCNPIIGKVVACTEHPNTDKLVIVTVDTNLPTGPLQTVCGKMDYPHVGQNTLIVTIGSLVYDDSRKFIINPSNIRGFWTTGMVCQRFLLGILENQDEHVIFDDPNAPIGMSLGEYLVLS